MNRSYGRTFVFQTVFWDAEQLEPGLFLYSILWSSVQQSRHNHMQFSKSLSRKKNLIKKKGGELFFKKRPEDEISIVSSTAICK